MTLAERMALFDASDLYVVITEAFCGGRPALEVLDAVLDAGVSLIQFREKGMEDGELFRRAGAFRARIPAGNALLIVDDRVDVALAVGADGVHLGQSDLPVPVARRLAPDLIIGASTHDMKEAMAAQNAGASYANIGPIFGTQTKSVPTGPVGPGLLGEITPHLRIPFTCMGGIKAHNIGEVVAYGARHVAVVTAVTAAADIRAAAAELRRAIRSPGRP